MKQQILAAAVAAAFVGAPLAASAETTLYGQFSYEVGAVENAAGDRVANQSYRGTRIGIRGGEDLGNGLRAMFVIQGGVTPNGSWGVNEEVNVGLSGGFGQLRLGQSDTAFKLANNRFRVFVDMLPEVSAAGTQVNNFIPFNNSRAQGIHYRSPSFAGFTVNATVAGGALTGAAGNPIPGAPTNDPKNAYGSLSVVGDIGPITVSAGFETIDRNAPGPNDRGTINNYSIGASYSAGGLMAGLLFQEQGKTTRNTSNVTDSSTYVYTLPVTYRMGNIGLRAAVQYRDPQESGFRSTTDYALGASYFLSRRTQVMANVWQTTAYVDGMGNRLDAGTSTDNRDRDTHFSVGVRHSF